MIGRRAGEVAGAIRHRRAQDILQGGRLTKEGNGKGAPALVGVVVTWESAGIWATGLRCPPGLLFPAGRCCVRGRARAPSFTGASHGPALWF